MQHDVSFCIRVYNAVILLANQYDLKYDTYDDYRGKSTQGQSYDIRMWWKGWSHDKQFNREMETVWSQKVKG